MNGDSREQRREWVFFGVLVVILLIILAGTALLRPLIFERIVPAVLGLDRSLPAEPAPADEPTPTPVPDVSDEVAPPVEISPTPGEETGEEPAGDPTALPTIRYVIQPGDNLTRIAQQHGVTIALLVALNDLENPDRLTPGTVLIIPQQ